MSIATPTTVAERDSRTHYLRRLVLTARQLEWVSLTGDTEQIMDAVEGFDAATQQARTVGLLPEEHHLAEEDLHAAIGTALARAVHAQHPVETAATLLGDTLDARRRCTGTPA